jgi:fatty-acid peroxygenase
VLDAALPLLADPSRYISRRCAALGTDLFETRLRLRPAICMRGADAARLFYDPDRFARAGGVDRKPVFPALLEAGATDALVAAFVREWEAAVPGWQAAGTIRFASAIQATLTRAVCGWAGIPLATGEVPTRTRQLARPADPAGVVGAARWLPPLAGIGAERWIGGLVRRARAGEPVFAAGSPAEIIALHTETARIHPRDAAVALLDLLRPAVAASAYIAFIVHALARYPHAAESLSARPSVYARAFVDEVRRLYPFSPPLTARVRQDFEWRGAVFRRGRRVLLDLYGTNHHPEWWEQPEAFRPERFLGLAPNPWSFIPQGGGPRAPGESMTIALIEAASGLLAMRMDYVLPAQDLSVDFAHVPALPKSGVVMRVTGMR